MVVDEIDDDDFLSRQEKEDRENRGSSCRPSLVVVWSVLRVSAK
jgi:hypothetical protein